MWQTPRTTLIPWTVFKSTGICHTLTGPPPLFTSPKLLDCSSSHWPSFIWSSAYLWKITYLCLASLKTSYHISLEGSNPPLVHSMHRSHKPHMEPPMNVPNHPHPYSDTWLPCVHAAYVQLDTVLSFMYESCWDNLHPLPHQQSTEFYPGVHLLSNGRIK